MCDRDHKAEFNPTSFWLFIALLSLAVTARQALAADEAGPAAREGAPAVLATPSNFPDRITTLDGKTYEKTSLVKVDPDGLLVAFAPVEGGMGTAKLKFRNLPAELRKRYGYDPDRAAEYESARAHGEAVWSSQNALWTEQRRAAQAEETAWERQMRAQAELRAAAEAEQAARYGEEPAYYNNPGWLWPYYPTSHHARPASHPNHMPQHMPVMGSAKSPISPTIGPMRPLGK